MQPMKYGLTAKLVMPGLVLDKPGHDGPGFVFKAALPP